MSCHQLRKFGSHFSSARCRRLSSERFTLLGMRSLRSMISPGNADVLVRITSRPARSFTGRNQFSRLALNADEDVRVPASSSLVVETGLGRLSIVGQSAI